MSASGAMALTAAIIVIPALFAIGPAVIFDSRFWTRTCCTLMVIGFVLLIIAVWMAVES